METLPPSTLPPPHLSNLLLKSDGSGNDSLENRRSSLFTDYVDYQKGEVYLLNRPLQCLVISLILVSAVALNSLVVHNISCCHFKQRATNFLLIQNLCIADAVGALLVLPAPLVATAVGKWDFGDAFCTVNSVICVALWLQHFLMFALIKVDRALANCLPLGRYPMLPPYGTLAIVVLAWLGSFFSAAMINGFYESQYEPAVVFCIPDLPKGFFISLFTFYVLGLVSMVLGYSGLLLHLRRKQRRLNAANAMFRIADFRGLERATLVSFAVTLSHFLLYVPTMLVIGLHGWVLHPAAILLCDLVVYSEFLIHPTVLLATSKRMRAEIGLTVKQIARKLLPCLWRSGGIFWCCSLKPWQNRSKVGDESKVMPSPGIEDEYATEDAVATTNTTSAASPVATASPSQRSATPPVPVPTKSRPGTAASLPPSTATSARCDSRRRHNSLSGRQQSATLTAVLPPDNSDGAEFSGLEQSVTSSFSLQTASKASTWMDSSLFATLSSSGFISALNGLTSDGREASEKGEKDAFPLEEMDKCEVIDVVAAKCQAADCEGGETVADDVSEARKDSLGS